MNISNYISNYQLVFMKEYESTEFLRSPGVVANHKESMATYIFLINIQSNLNEIFQQQRNIFTVNNNKFELAYLDYFRLISVLKASYKISSCDMIHVCLV